MHDLEVGLLSFVSQEWVWRILVGLGIAVVGIWLARWISRGFDRLLSRTRVEEILRNFLRHVCYALVVIVVVVIALDFAGVPTTSLLAVMGAAGLGIGLALKDSLSNIASGVMLIALRPFHAGDRVQVCGIEGIVDSVRIFQTRLHTADNRMIFLPNSQITIAPIVNYTARGTRRIDLAARMAYGDDLDALRAMLLEVAHANRDVQSTPAPEVQVSAMDDAGASVQLRAWVDAHAHTRVQSELQEAVLAAYRTHRLAVPRTGRDLYVIRQGDGSGTPASPDGAHTPLPPV